MRALPFLLAVSGFAASVGNIQVTATQALIQVSYTGSTCTVVLYSDSARTITLDDTNETLFPGSSQCNRTGSAGNVFVAGLRASQLASDGLWHSRALPANSTLYGTLTGDTVVNFSFTTGNPPYGNTSADLPPFNASAPYNYSWPTLRPILDRNKWITDPQTGMQVNMWSRPVQDDPNALSGIAINLPGLKAFDAANNGNWTTGSGSTGCGGSACVNATANTDPLFIRLTPWCVGGNSVAAPGSSQACPQGQGTWGENGDQAYPTTIDDIQIVLTMAGTGATNSAQFALTVDGVNPATDWQTQAITSSATAYRFPASGGSASTCTGPGYPSTLCGTGANATVVGYWFANQVSNLLTRPDMQPHTGTVTSTSGVLTVTAGENFRMSSCSVGSYITLVSTDYRITACTDPTHVTIASPPADGSYAYIIQRFGVLVRKTTATTGNLSVTGATFSDYESSMGQMPISGLVDIQATYTVTDSGGNVLRPTMLLQGGESHNIYVIDENTGFSRFIGIAEGNGGCFTNNCTPGVSSSLNQFRQPSSSGLGSLFTLTPNHWMLTSTDAGSNIVLIDGSYNPSGSGSCPNNWQEITAYNCPTFPYNDNMTWFNATPQLGADSLDHRPATQATAYATAHSLVTFSPSQLLQSSGTDPVDPQLGWGQIGYFAGGQNTIAWFVVFSTTSIPYSVIAMGNTYSSVNCRFCPDHGGGALGGIEGISTEDVLTAGSGVGIGPMVVQTSTSLTTATPATCPTLLPPYDSFSGTANCADLILAGLDVCHTTPNGSEVAPMYGPCTWNGAYTHLAGINLMVGDLMDDGSSSGEMFRVVKITGSVATVLRAYATPSATLGQFARTSSLANHTTVPWQLRELCSANAGANGGQGYFNLNIDSTAQNGIADFPLYITSHADWWNGNMDEAGRIRTGFPSYAGQLNQPISFTANEYAPFNSVQPANASSFIQSHGALSRDSTTPNYEVDLNPFSSSSSATNTLWTQNITNVSGQLWRIAAADVQNGGASWPNALKSVPLVTWSGINNIQDVSSAATGNVIGTTSTDSWKKCIAWRVNECRTGSSVGDVYINVPQSGAVNGANVGPWDYSRNIAATTLDGRATGLNQYDFNGIATFAQTGVSQTITDGRTYRKLSNLFNKANFQSVFSSAHSTFRGNWAFGHSEYYGGGLRSDLMLVRLPPPPNIDTINRSTFVQIPIQISGVSGDQVRARFGYAENGAASSLFCTSRQESCSTAGAAPFVFVGDSQTWLACGSGCILQIPVIPGRVLYYVVDRMNASGSISSSRMQIIQ